MNIHSAIFKLKQHKNGHGNRNRYGHGHGNGYGHEIGKLLLSISYGAIVPIAPFGMPPKYQGAISNGAIYL
jgi:hypothetical protein